MRKKILVRGPILTRSGYGEHARFVMRALQTIEDKVDLYAVPTNWGSTGWTVEVDEERRWLDFIIQKTTFALNKNMKEFDMSIQISIPNEWEKLAPVNIGITAGIETTKVAPQWVEKGNMMDLIIVPSEHSKNVYENTQYQVTVNETGQKIPDYHCATPIEVVSYPVKEFDNIDLDLELTTDFNFLAIAQWGPRKNIVNCIQWFLEEFIDQEVGLVLKTNMAKNSILDRRNIEAVLRNILAQEKYKDRKCKLYLLHGDMSDQEIHQLYRNPKIKAFVTATHGEGFGLPLFEAAYEGLPVIAPDWSGHVDFLYKKTKDKKGRIKNKALYAKVDCSLGPVQKEAVWDGVVQADSMWCFADQGSFKIKLREVYKDYGRFKKQAKQLQTYIRKNLSATNQNKLMANVILDIIKEKELDDVPKEVLVFS
tara:strand:- start:3590 stop:4861 length:1272 start_codon:yes stop_codon:yes gene_type:complete